MNDDEGDVARQPIEETASEKRLVQDGVVQGPARDLPVVPTQLRAPIIIKPTIPRTFMQALEGEANRHARAGELSDAMPARTVGRIDSLPARWIGTPQDSSGVPRSVDHDAQGFKIGEGRVEVAGGGALHGSTIDAVTSDMHDDRPVSAQGGRERVPLELPVISEHCNWRVDIRTSYKEVSNLDGVEISGTRIRVGLVGWGFYDQGRWPKSRTVVRLVHDPGTHCKRVRELRWESGFLGEIALNVYRGAAAAASGVTGSGEGDHQYGKSDKIEDNSLLPKRPSPKTVSDSDSGIRAGNVFTFTMVSEVEMQAVVGEERSKVDANASIQHRFFVYAYGESPNCHLWCNLYEEESGIVATSWNCESARRTKAFFPPKIGKGPNEWNPAWSYSETATWSEVKPGP